MNLMALQLVLLYNIFMFLLLSDLGNIPAFVIAGKEKDAQSERLKKTEEGDRKLSSLAD